MKIETMSRGAPPERAQNRDVGALFLHDHHERRDDVERGDRDDEQQHEEHDRLRDLEGAEEIPLAPAPVADEIAAGQRLPDRSDELRRGIRVVKPVAQARHGIAQPEEPLGIGEVHDREPLVELVHAGVDEAGHREPAHARRDAGGRDVALCDDDEHAVAAADPELVREPPAEQHAPATGVERAEPAVGQVLFERRDASLRVRLHRAQVDGRGTLAGDQHGVALHERCDCNDAVLAARLLHDRAPVSEARSLPLKRRVGDDVEDPAR
jgi:hypothetical protein